MADFLGRGQVYRAYLGESVCVICGAQNGSLELSDGTYSWPEGFAHYVSAHNVRPPIEFERHVLEALEALEAQESTDSWWRGQIET